MNNLLDDVRFALRLLRKSPAFTIIAVLTLALGIGANTAIFSVINGVLLRTLPYDQPDRLVVLYESSREFDHMAVSFLNFEDWEKTSKSIQAMAIFRDDDFNLTGSGNSERVSGRMASSGLFPILNVQPVLGRAFNSTEDRKGGTPVVLLGEKFWTRKFGADRSILGRAINLNGTPHVVIGVLPASFRFRGEFDVTVPIRQWNSPAMDHRDMHPGANVVARLAPGFKVEQARAELDNIARTLAQQFPEANKDHGIAAVPLKDDVVGGVRPLLWLLLGSVAFVLLIACANVANLLLSRATSRQKEIAVRAALGASRVRIVRQLLAESTILALAGGTVGLLMAAQGTETLLRYIPDSLPRVQEIGIDFRVLAFTLLASIVTGVLFGLVPAMQLSRPDLNNVLRESGRGLAGGRHTLRDLLAIAQVAMALVLLAGGSLLIRSLWKLNQVNPGFDPTHVLTMHISLSPANTKTPENTRRAYRQILESMRQIPGIEAAAVSFDLPLSGDDSEVPVYRQDRPKPASQSETPWALMYPTTPEYLRVMKIPLLKGRFFDDHDDQNAPTVVLIDEDMAASMFPGEDPIGKRMMLLTIPLQVVGVVGHVRHWGLDKDSTAKVRSQMYFALAQIPDEFMTVAGYNTFVMRTTTPNPLAMAEAVKSQITGADRDQPIYGVRSMEQVVQEGLAQRRFLMLLLGIFAAVALILATIGIYGVISYSVSQRVREVGLRMALGASQLDVLGMVIRQGALISVIGVAAGVVTALVVTRWMSSLIYGVSTTDPLSFIGVAALLTVVALFASYLPARRATKVDPMEALRSE